MYNYRDDIERYRNGTMKAEEMHALEKKALNDPFLADALEGIEHVAPQELISDLADLHQKITGEKKEAFSWKWPMRIAAALAFLVVSGILVYRFIATQPTTSDLALNKEMETDEKRSQASSSDEMRDAPGDSAEESSTIAPQPEQQSQIAASDRDDQSIVSGATVSARQETQAERPSALLGEDDTIATEAQLLMRIAQPTTIRGRILSSDDGQPLPNARVATANDQIATRTDAQGNYEITVPDTNATLVAGYAGYSEKKIAVGNERVIDFQLSPAIDRPVDIAAAETLASRSAAEEEKNAGQPTSPENYQTYLNQNVRYPDAARANNIEGTVVVEFTVERSGRLTGFQVIQGIGSGCDEELVRVIREGPRWSPATENGRTVARKARVTYTFDLP